MLLPKRATLAVVAQLHYALSSAVVAETPPIEARLINELHRWIDIATDLPAADTAATIVFVDSEDVTKPSDMASLIGKVPRGFYDPDISTITLVRPWSVDNLQDVSVLLHELVHHRQRGKHFYCEAAKEHAAYNLQKDWLVERGLKLDVRWIAVVLASSCAARDRHP